MNTRSLRGRCNLDQWVHVSTDCRWGGVQVHEVPQHLTLIPCHPERRRCLWFRGTEGFCIQLLDDILIDWAPCRGKIPCEVILHRQLWDSQDLFMNQGWWEVCIESGVPKQGRVPRGQPLQHLW